MTKLPPGFRFQPTDEEIVFQYLARKTFSRPLPAPVVHEINIFNMDPWDLPGNSEQDWYFFNNITSSDRGISRTKKPTCSGFWKTTCLEKPITGSTRMPIVGIKKTLVFYKERNHKAIRTTWFMNVYFIALVQNRACSHSKKKHSQGSIMRVGKWTLCHVFSKKNMTNLPDNNGADDSSCSSSSTSFSSSDTDNEVSSSN